MTDTMNSEDSSEENSGGSIHEARNSHNVILNFKRKYFDGKEFINSVEDLPPHIFWDGEQFLQLKKVAQTYHIRIPLYYFSLISNVFDKHDPIRKQCLPHPDELNKDSFGSEDPLAEKKNSPFDCLVHRYPDRVLLLVTNRCFMYCRHCTRKRIWNRKVNEPTLENINSALDYVRGNPKIREIIVSGGDPLTLSSEYLDNILSKINSCTNIQVVRIGTRAPIVFPQRIDARLCDVLEKYNNIWVNVQFNHPREITPQSVSACRKLQKLGIPLSNQSVLLKGINDNIQTMCIGVAGETGILRQLFNMAPYMVLVGEVQGRLWGIRT